MTRARGFTLVELVLTIIVVGIVAVYAAPRMAPSPFDAQAAAQELVEAIRYAQSMSMNSSGANPYRITITTAGYSVSQNGAPVVNPLTGSAPYTDDNWAGKGIGTNTSTTVFFNSRGRPFDQGSGNPLGANLLIQVSAGSASANVRLEQLTGYARVQ
jgi:MSHA pilin protein MshC